MSFYHYVHSGVSRIAVMSQGLQSCLESQLIETRTLRLKLASPRPHLSESIIDTATEQLEEKCQYKEINKKALYASEDHLMSSNLEVGGWSFLQALSNTTQSDPKEEMSKESPYVPPLGKRSSSILSDKSLELCTENLGSETGTDIVESSIFSFPSLDCEGGKSPTREQPKSRQCVESRKVSARNFPPPLTTMSSANPVRIRPHREGGRLIINAVEAPSPYAYLQAERSNGRLRLSFLKDCDGTTFDSEVAAAVENDESSEENEKGVFENEANDEEQEEEEEEFEEQEDDGGESVACVEKDMDGNSIDAGVEMGVEKFQRPTRCKEGGRGKEGLCNWEPLWVATT
ncbi:protein FANTASTIC FOUR 3-like [Cornus florida]|uniref:protein FANTASTIC FOUR 3-like n=1 Tax=Cornus florida TaxID=4283 RepID=UPI0028998A31|nr:protein FANTASTIC FOUR 3-like [Cornus florida]